MLKTRPTGSAALAVVAALALPATAAAATKTVSAGPPSSVMKVVAKLHDQALGAYNPDVNAFFNQRTTIHAGDKVKFVLNGFHTVDLAPKGKGDLPLIVPGPLVAGANDAAGNPFWFNGKVPRLGLDPVLFARSKGTTFTGTTRLDSGLASSKPFVVKFTKPGTYKFFCDVHPGMVGYITVKPKAAKIPTAKQDAATLLKQETAAIKGAAKLLKTTEPADTVSLGLSTSQGVELYDMFPSTLSVKKGTVVTFRMSAHSRETHTATFGPFTSAGKPGPYLTALSNSFNSPSFSPIGTYPSDPGQPITGSSSAHGNGFFNTGTLDNDPTTPVGPSSKIDFTTPGTYHYQCLIHPFMQGTIVVTS